MKDNRLRKAFDKCKVIHALKQPKNLLRLLSKPKIQTSISGKYGLYWYEWKESVIYAYIQKCSSFITSNGHNWEIRCHINCQSPDILYLLSCNFEMVIPHTLAKL